MKIAIIGTGISGLGCAYALSGDHLKNRCEVHLFEKNEYLGGHTNTKVVREDHREIPIDTGFIVFNEKNYPNLTALFKTLNISCAPSDMSFAVSMNNGAFEYSGRSLAAFFAMQSAWISPRHYRLGYEIIRFNKIARQVIMNPKFEVSLGDFLGKYRFSKHFSDHYITPMAASIWSTPSQKMLDFSARSLFEFFDNHGLLAVSSHPQWYTVESGARTYVEKLIDQTPVTVHRRSEVKSVIHQKNGVRLWTQEAQFDFDHVVFATPAHVTLDILGEGASEGERNIFSKFKYEKNRAYLHRDPSQMPRRKKAWAAWNYLSQSQTYDPNNKLTLTYWMNVLQPLKTKTDYFVTLNPQTEIDPRFTHEVIAYEHPIFNRETRQAQEKLIELSQNGRLRFCGAYHGYGFHEDGLKSGVKAALTLGGGVPWDFVS